MSSPKLGSVGLVGHSMGGIILRTMLGNQLLRTKPIDELVKLVVFVASPLSGAWLSKFARYLPGSAMAQVAELSPSSPYLMRIKAQWFAWLARQDHLRESVRSIYAANDEVVDCVSAMGEDPDAIPILGIGHSEVIKPEAGSDDIVRTLSRFATEAGLGGR